MLGGRREREEGGGRGRKEKGGGRGRSGELFLKLWLSLQAWFLEWR